LQESSAYTRRCRELTEAAPALGKATIGFSAYLWARLHGASLEAWSGDIPGALRAVEAVIRASRESGETEMLGWAVGTQVQILTMLAGELGDAPALAREGVAASERAGSPFSQVHSRVRLGMVQLFQDDVANAIASLEGALALARERRTGTELEPFVLALLSRAHLAAGDRPRAAAIADEALRMARDRGSRIFELEGLGALVRALLADADVARAADIEALVDGLSKLAEECGARTYLPQAAELRAALCRLRGESAARERHLRAAQGLYAEMGATGHAARLARELTVLV
jgi:tetratricopeptide (TPR) repeat protein